MKRRTHRELYVDALRELSNGGTKMIGNGTLLKRLDWPLERYERIKEELQREKAIVISRGKGGAVGLANIVGAKALNVFVSYSHVDEAIKSQLMAHLKPLERMQLIESWSDQKLKPGDVWEKEISSKIAKADIILLLVSVDFINSRYCYESELEQALEMHDKHQAAVIPIIIRPCLWQHSSFAHIQALPSGGKAVSVWENMDLALADVSESIRKLAEVRLNSKQ